MAFHISNRYLDLAPVLARAAAVNGLSALLREHRVDFDTKREGGLSSDWMVMGEPGGAPGAVPGAWVGTCRQPAGRSRGRTRFRTYMSVVRWRGRRVDDR